MQFLLLYGSILEYQRRVVLFGGSQEAFGRFRGDINSCKHCWEIPLLHCVMQLHEHGLREPPPNPIEQVLSLPLWLLHLLLNSQLFCKYGVFFVSVSIFIAQGRARELSTRAVVGASGVSRVHLPAQAQGEDTVAHRQSEGTAKAGPLLLHSHNLKHDSNYCVLYFPSSMSSCCQPALRQGLGSGGWGSRPLRVF